jgi:hypothetical protein
MFFPQCWQLKMQSQIKANKKKKKTKFTYRRTKCIQRQGIKLHPENGSILPQGPPQLCLHKSNCPKLSYRLLQLVVSLPPNHLPSMQLLPRSAQQLAVNPQLAISSCSHPPAASSSLPMNQQQPPLPKIKLSTKNPRNRTSPKLKIKNYFPKIKNQQNLPHSNPKEMKIPVSHSRNGVSLSKTRHFKFVFDKKSEYKFQSSVFLSLKTIKMKNRRA